MIASYTGPQVLSGGTVSSDGSGKTVHTFTSSATSTLDLHAATISGNIDGVGGNLVWNKTGKLTLSGNNGYTGSTTISSGSLEVHGSISSSSGISNSTALIFNSGSAQSFGNAITGSGTLTKQGAGTLTLSGDNNYSGATTVSAGTLVVSGTGDINGSTSLTVDSGATFRYNSSTALTIATITNNGAISGSGNLGAITLGGAGSIDPGNSPGVLTAAATDPTAGLDYNFEFTAANTPPTWNAPTNSVNDVLRLTDATTPFTGNLDGDNFVNIYLNVASLTAGQTFTGGFYTDKNASFLTSITGADFNYFLANPSGAVTYNGVNYDAYTGPPGISWDVVSQTADFGGGPVNGYVTQFTVAIPEPRAALLGGIGLLFLLRRRRP